jgi:hypothetical protein
MAAALPASLLDSILGLVTQPAAPAADNRFSLEGLTLAPGKDGATEVGVRKIEAAALRLASGPLVLEVGQLAVHGIAAQVGQEAGRPQLRGLHAAGAEFSGVKVHGPLDFSPQSTAQGSWSLAPLASAEGAIRAEIVDAHLLFDADVSVPIRQGVIEFKDATVEHVGPDSRMGVSRLGIYVDAPNGRSYLYQFSSPPVAGVEYERRGAMLGPWVTDRGRLQLQAFAEWLLRQPLGGQLQGVTEQARLLFDRTAVSGEVRLGDGRFAAPGVQADLAGRAEGRNAVRVHSEAVGRGVTVAIDALSARAAAFAAGSSELRCDDVAGKLTLHVSRDGTALRFAFELANLKITGLHLQPKA